MRARACREVRFIVVAMARLQPKTCSQAQIDDPAKKGSAPVWPGALPNISLVRYGIAVFKNAGEHR